MVSFTGIIGALSGAAIGGAISYYITFVLLNSLFVTLNTSATLINVPGNEFPTTIPAIWNLVLVLLPLSVAAIIGGVIVKLFD